MIVVLGSLNVDLVTQVERLAWQPSVPHREAIEALVGQSCP